jgi:nitrogenase molybdenum-iron protein alpha/beta subunit
MPDYLTNITPDSFSGMIFALEGVKRAVVLLNGPTGCKFYHSATSDNQTLRQFEFDPLNYPEKWYFGQPRVPCTYLDNGDYVYGSADKLAEALNFLRERVPFDLLAIVNSPGAALIGDDLRGIAEPVLGDRPLVTLETPGFSSDVCAGHEEAALALLTQVELNELTDIRPKAVNVLGLSLFHRNHTGDVRELERLLTLGGVEVNCLLCAGGDLESVKNVPRAALNVVVYPEYGLKIAEFLRDRYGTPFYVCPGPPVGFEATEKLMADVCGLLGTDFAPVLADSERARARAYAFLSRVSSLTGLPKGVAFAAEGTYSELYAYTDFFVRYFGMVPDCLSVLNPGSDAFSGRLEALLNELGVPGALNRDILDTNAELVFGSGNTIARLKLKKHIFSGIETALPSLGYYDVVPKTHLGVSGALLLIEQVLNGLIY